MPSVIWAKLVPAIGFYILFRIKPDFHTGFGVCCIFISNGCGGDIVKNNTYIQNPSYPSPNK